MQKYHLPLRLSAEPFDNLRYRDRTVLIVMRNSKGEFVLETGNYYPEGIARLLGGGVEKNEDPQTAAVREMKEEVGVEITKNDLQPVAQLDIDADYRGKKYKHSISLFSVNIPMDHKIHGDGDVIVYYSEEQFRDLISKYENLKPEFLRENGDYVFSWGDYGKVYGFIHKAAYINAVNPDNRKKI